jgi:1-acyl-sn-glycerol-3-phosphate acyltransferase
VTINQIKKALYATYLTNYYGFKIKQNKTSANQKKYRIEYSKTLLNALNITIKVINKEKLPPDGKYLLLSNHKSVIDPLIVETALKDTAISGHWVAKKELYNSFFFGIFVRNAGTILLDRERKQMGSFFSDIKECVQDGSSIFIFPEGTRNKTQEPLIEFQGGAQMIALKNRLPILPVYIKTDANKALMDSLHSGEQKFTIEIEIGDIIDYKDRKIPLREKYKKVFNIS